jgi:hypothetical protein
VGGEEHGLAALPLGRHELAEVEPAHGVEPVERLVEDEELRIVEERLGQAEPLAHALRVAAHRTVGRVGEPDLVEEEPRALEARRAVEPGQPAVEVEVLQGREAVVEERRLGEVADEPLGEGACPRGGRRSWPRRPTAGSPRRGP